MFGVDGRVVVTTMGGAEVEVVAGMVVVITVGADGAAETVVVEGSSTVIQEDRAIKSPGRIPRRSIPSG